VIKCNWANSIYVTESINLYDPELQCTWHVFTQPEGKACRNYVGPSYYIG
jgi:hypothetical protein